MRPSDDLTAHHWLCKTLSPFWSDEIITVPDEHLWPEIVRLSDSWLVSARLEDRLRECNFVPDEARDVLTAIGTYTRERAERMRHELSQIISTLNAVDIQPVVFKGAEWLLGHYRPGSYRMMSDLDIWIPSDPQQERGLKALQEKGFVPMKPLSEHDKAVSHHFPPLHREGNVARLEVHHKLIRSSLTAVMALEGAENRLVATTQNGLSYRRLAPSDGITVAYLQSGRMAHPNFDTRRVTVSKWLDFLDRLHDFGPSRIRSASDVGLLVKENDVDRQLLTVLQDFFGLPYEGVRDTRYIDTWATPVSAKRLLFSQLRRAATWDAVRSTRKWRSFLINFKRRVKINRFHSKL